MLTQLLAENIPVKGEGAHGVSRSRCSSVNSVGRRPNLESPFAPVSEKTGASRPRGIPSCV